MADTAKTVCSDADQALTAEIIRLNKIIESLMNRAERDMNGAGSSFSLFETAIMLESQVRERTRALEAALRENERTNRALHHTKRQMEHEIEQRKRFEAELNAHRDHLESLVAERTSELAALEAHTRLILESSADCLFGLDLAGKVTFINPAACKTVGYSPEQVLGRPLHALIHHTRADGSFHPVEECPMHVTLHSGLDNRMDQDVFWHASGHPIPVMYAAHPMIRDGKVVGAVVSFRDISDRQATERAREQALLEAEHLARSRQEFLANMSHEIRTPLNGVLGLAQIGYQDSAGRKDQKIFGRILESGKLLLGIINDILDFSKIEAGKLKIEAVPLQPDAIIKHVVALMQERALAKGIALTVDRSLVLPASCLGDPLRIEQVLLNLLSNAVKFTERGGVTLCAGRQGEWLRFTVADSGIGMSEEQVGRLFTPFEQADGSTTRRYGGTGLGLAISKRLVELMGGEIHVESQPARGSRFEVRLPLIEAAGLPATTAPLGKSIAPPSSPRLAGITVLVAEDAEINQLVIEAFLTREGARVVMVGDGRQALERVMEDGREAFDIVLMDIQMPVMDGYEATRRMGEIAPELPVVGQTAHVLPQERETCLAAGMVGHLAKPIDVEKLVAVVLRYAGKRKASVDKPGPNASSIHAAASDESNDVMLQIDWQALAARFGGDLSFIDKLAASLLRTHADAPTRLREAARAGDLPTLAFLTHNVKGVIGNLMAPPLYDLAKQAEDAARNQQPQAVALAEALTQPLEQLLAQASKYVDERTA